MPSQITFLSPSGHVVVTRLPNQGSAERYGIWEDAHPKGNFTQVSVQTLGSSKLPSWQFPTTLTYVDDLAQEDIIKIRSLSPVV
jgi:hypothetical protein